MQERVRAWWAAPLQKRRRARATPQPPLPVIIGADFQWWGEAYPGWGDAFVFWTIDCGSFPAASVEVWFHLRGQEEQHIATVPSLDGVFNHGVEVSPGDDLFYRLRYWDRDVVGAFTSEFQFHIAG